MRNLKIATVLAAILMLAQPVHAESSFTTLGTIGGPVPHPERMQPANLLIDGDEITLVDAADGVAHRLAGAHVAIWNVNNLLISHLHFDHMGGLYSLLGLRFQTAAPKPLHVYGPPGTIAMVEGLLVAMAPAMEAAYGVPGAKTMPIEQLVVAHEISSGDVFELGTTKVTTVANTHYSFVPGSELAAKYQSLSFRFETSDRTYVYTGDTGPSDAVTELAKGADVFVAEMIDIDAVIGMFRKARPNMPDDRIHEMTVHLSTHHLTPTDLGKMAEAAGVKKLVVTHLAVGPRFTKEDIANWVAEIKAEYNGDVVVANDLDRF